jgi:hypothetical protein
VRYGRDLIPSTESKTGRKNKGLVGVPGAGVWRALLCVLDAPFFWRALLRQCRSYSSTQSTSPLFRNGREGPRPSKKPPTPGPTSWRALLRQCRSYSSTQSASPLFRNGREGPRPSRRPPLPDPTSWRALLRQCRSSLHSSRSRSHGRGTRRDPPGQRLEGIAPSMPLFPGDARRAVARDRDPPEDRQRPSRRPGGHCSVNAALPGAAHGRAPTDGDRELASDHPAATLQAVSCARDPRGNEPAPRSSPPRFPPSHMRRDLRTSSLILWMCPRPRALTSQPSSKYLRISASSRIPKQSTTAIVPPAHFTTSSGSRLR